MTKHRSFTSGRVTVYTQTDAEGPCALVSSEKGDIRLSLEEARGLYQIMPNVIVELQRMGATG